MTQEKIKTQDYKKIQLYPCEACKVGIFVEDKDGSHFVLCNNTDCKITENVALLEISVVHKPCCTDIWLKRPG